MPGNTPATSQLDWLSTTTAMIVLSWSKAARDLLKSFSWGIRALRQLFASDDGAISSPPAPYHLSAGGRWIRTLGPPSEGQRFRRRPLTPSGRKSVWETGEILASHQPYGHRWAPAPLLCRFAVNRHPTAAIKAGRSDLTGVGESSHDRDVCTTGPGRTSLPQATFTGEISR